MAQQDGSARAIATAGSGPGETADDEAATVDIVASSVEATAGTDRKVDSAAEPFKLSAEHLAGLEGRDPNGDRPAAPAALPARTSTSSVAGSGDIPEVEGLLFTLSVSGSIGDAALTESDAQTWARVGYFLQTRQPTPCFLVRPDGSIPIIQQGDAVGPPPPVVRPIASEEDRKNPPYRLAIEAHAVYLGPITTYGRVVGSKYQCNLVAVIEERTADGYSPIEQVSASEMVTPMGGGDPSEATTQAYDLGLESLLQRLAGARFFFEGK